MAEIPESKTSPGPTEGNAAPAVRATALVREYLLERLPIYRELQDLRNQGWQIEAADNHFHNQRERADKANSKTQAGFFKLMRSIGFELDDATSALTIRADNGNTRPAILDLCMAPGGFASAALSRNPRALLRGISLPPSQGGHKMLLHNHWSNTDPTARIFVSFRDITLLADEMGTPAASIPASHPEAASFSPDRPFLAQQFDLVLCDGQVLRTHERPEYRQPFEATRLLTSQLVLGLQRLRSGGTVVVLLHRADKWSSVLLMATFAAFSDSVVLVKPERAHRTRSSFYLVAKGVRPEREAAAEAVRAWKAKWSLSTFQLGDGTEGLDEAELEVLGSGGEEKVGEVLRDFGPELMRMAEPVFAIQAEALRAEPWMKSAGAP